MTKEDIQKEDNSKYKIMKLEYEQQRWIIDTFKHEVSRFENVKNDNPYRTLEIILGNILTRPDKYEELLKDTFHTFQKVRIPMTKDNFKNNDFNVVGRIQSIRDYEATVQVENFTVPMPLNYLRVYCDCLSHPSVAGIRHEPSYCSNCGEEL